jgi:hypothetical protein
MVSPRQPQLPPNRLFREFESGRMSRVDFQRAMAEHARELIDEMVEQRRNPVEAFMDYIRNRRIASKLSKGHGEAAVREVFSALAEASDFPPASLLWNAGHRHVPLYCFIRDRKAPVFRVRDLKIEREAAGIDVEYGDRSGRHLTREVFKLRRGWHGNLFVEDRQVLRR